MTTLHLGVLDLPYADASYKEVGQRKPKTKSTGSATTGDVAEFLENDYHVIESFYTVNEADIAERLAESSANALTAIMNGADPSTFNPVGEGTSEIEEEFREFLSMQVMDSMGVPNVPTHAAEMGWSKRFKKSKAKRASRPSFIDTGLYQNSFRVWVTE
jgi:hypothetical protein